MSEDLYEGTHRWGTFALRSGPNRQTVTLLAKEEGRVEISELLTFTVVAGRLIYSSANSGLHLQKGSNIEK
jgi:hypothetical protein